MELKDSAQYIKGVGPKRFQILNHLGVYTVEDLLYYFPRRYEDRRTFSPIARVQVGNYATVKGAVISLNLRRSKRGLAIFQIAVGDDSGVILAVWFNQPFMKRYFKVGQGIILYGKVELFQRIQMNNPEFEFVSRKDSYLHMGRITPIYPLTAKINQRYLRSIIDRALAACHSFIPDVLPYTMRKRLNLLPATIAVRNIHFPQDFTQRESAYRRLVFEEFFLFQMILALKKIRPGAESQGIAHQAQGKLIETFLKRLPFQLTPSQKKVISEIEQDMHAPRPMNRLLQGEVGSGKTIVAAYALVLSVQSGWQVALMAPTEILAEQHYFLLSKLLMPLGINVGLLIGSMSRQARLSTLQDAQSAALNVLVGTHALIEQDLQFKQLGLVIIDEQHKFGLSQRALLRKKNERCDCLIMTATPIPRTLAMTVYGNLDISTIKELPKGRVPITTVRVGKGAVKSVYRFIREQVSLGRQAYLVYPLIKKSPLSEFKAASQMYQRLKNSELKGLKVGLIHGQLKAKDKEKVMRSFQNKKLDVLVSTTVIEVGIDIANATVMVIEHAERFGLSQLHQLRGRIGRGAHRSYCILVADPQSEQAKRRIEAMLASSDGFRLAEEDLDIRGPGQFFGPDQHGLPELRIGNIVRDMQLMELARAEAFNLVAADAKLKAREHLAISKKLQQRFHSKDMGLLTA